MFEDDTLIAFVDGMVTDQADLTDEMYENASMHQEDGAWQMIFGVNTLPAYRNHGYAGELLKRSDRRCKRPGKKRSCPYVQGQISALLCKIWF